MVGVTDRHHVRGVVLYVLCMNATIHNGSDAL